METSGTPSGEEAMDDQPVQSTELVGSIPIKSGKLDTLPNAVPNDSSPKNGDVTPEKEPAIINGECSPEEGKNKRKADSADPPDSDKEDDEPCAAKKSKVEEMEVDCSVTDKPTIVNGDVNDSDSTEPKNIPNVNGDQEKLEEEDSSPGKSPKSTPETESDSPKASADADSVDNTTEKKSEETGSTLEEMDSETSVLNLAVKSDTKSNESSNVSDKTETPSKEDSTVVNDPKEKPDNKESSGEAPMDLTFSNKPAGSDVIMLSDEEDQSKPINGLISKTPEDVKKRPNVVRYLQDDLRNEEAKLVLLKKIRQSQLLQPVEPTPPTKPAQPPTASNRPTQSGPPPLVKGSQQMPSHKQLYTGSNQPPQLTRVMPNSQHNPTRNLSRSSQSQGPPPLVMAPTARGHGQSQSTSSRHQSSSSHHLQSSRGSSSQPASAQPAVPTQPEQTPAQRQAAAKLALRKQLEKTLLQIPPPKPPPPEMNFIPSLAGNDFMLLVGLEEVVKFIVDIDARAKGEKGPEVKYVFNPFVCVQCGTDFTPVWKRDKPGSKNVICEQCVTSNQKKALKQEHTNRLKSAFVKALQQEQEIEQRMQAQTSATSSSNSTSSSHGTHHSSSRERERDRGDRERDRDRDRDHHHHHREESSHGSSRSHGSHSSHGHSSHRASPSGSSSAPNAASNPVNLSTNFKPTNEQIRQHQNLIQAHQAQLRGAALGNLPSGFNPRLMYPFTPQHLAAAAASSSSSKADLQRQYLLDMIPRSMPGGSVLWRT